MFKELYERVFRAPDYFVFDPFDPGSLAGWRLDLAQGYQPLSPNEQGWLWCETLGLWLGTWEGAIDREPMTGSCQWLRLYDSPKNLILPPEEKAQKQAEQEKQRADRLAEKLKQLGIDPSTLYQGLRDRVSWGQGAGFFKKPAP